MKNLLRNLTLVLVATGMLALSGCASAPRTEQDDSGVKTVAVVSMLQERAPVVRIGLTVLNNDTTVIDQSGVLNRVATDIVERHIRAKRPTWSVKSSGVDSTALAEKNRKAGTSWTSFTGNVTEDLRGIAKTTDADLLFVVIDTTMENTPGRGVGVSLRTITGSVGNALVHAHVLLVLVDRNGKEITNRAGGSVLVPAAELGLTYDLGSLSDPKIRERVSLAMQKQLAAALDRAATSLGY